MGPDVDDVAYCSGCVTDCSGGDDVVIASLLAELPCLVAVDSDGSVESLFFMVILGSDVVALEYSC